jgi:hypothetical protein
MNKEGTSSPTVAIELVSLSCIINADESHNVAAVNIFNAFLQADMNDIVHLRIDGDMATILINLAPNIYNSFLTSVCGTLTLYVILRNFPYVTPQGALLFWQKLSYFLTSWLYYHSL